MAFHDDYFFTSEEKYKFQEDVNATRYYRSYWDRAYVQIGLDDTVVNPCIYYLEFRGNTPSGNVYMNFTHEAILHIESGGVRIRSDDSTKFISQTATYPDFVEPLDFTELYSNIQNKSWGTWYVSDNSDIFGRNIGYFYMREYSNYLDWHTLINDRNTNLNMVSLWFSDYDKYQSAKNNIIHNKIITPDMLDGGTPIVDTEYDTVFYRKYQSVNYSVKNREYTCYVKANEENKEKAWLLLCYIKSINTIVWLHSINPSLNLTTDATVKYEWNGLIFDQTVNEYPDINEISDFNKYKGYISKYTLTKIPVEWKQSEYKLMNGKYTFKNMMLLKNYLIYNGGGLLMRLISWELLIT